MQRWLLEQGLLLLGDDRSYEAGVVLSALVARALQGSDVPPQGAERGGSPRDEAEEVERYRLASERISSVPGGRMPGTAAMHLLGGGPVAQMLVYHGFRGEHRCDELLRHLLPRRDVPPGARGLRRGCGGAPREDGARAARRRWPRRRGAGPPGRRGREQRAHHAGQLRGRAARREHPPGERAFLVIDAVTPTGLVHRWNCQEGSRFVRVEEGDRITAVNGIRGNSHAMLQECMQNKVLEILVEKRRPMQINIGHQQMQQAHSAPRQLPAGTAPLEDDAELLPPGAPRAAAHG
ncbi:unnamed protein product [Prorocentrum cordatum]|uniref:PDZ domain-containing protein n=1 Tax=Prorocentrum cordatum TaxID=2364126 RepID=A0ABN9RWA3_9DINO|nr:unnamed protein product [Polarella glacialis]